MTILKAIILGIIQGFTEFLPISSSGHLLLAEKFMGLTNDLFFSLINNPIFQFHFLISFLFFSLILHFATLLAVINYYWKDIVYIVKNPTSKLSKCLIVAFMPTIMLAIIVKKIIIYLNRRI